MAPHWLAIVAAVVLAELEHKDPGLTRRSRKRLEREEVTLLAAAPSPQVPSPADMLREEHEKALRWLSAMERVLRRR